MRSFWICTSCKLRNNVDQPACRSCKTPRTLNNQRPSAEGMKFDGDKPRTDLLDSDTLEEVARVLTFGAAKYAAHNWRKGIAASRLIGATLRHTFALMRGENRDPESGLHHAAHAICCLMFLFWTLQNKPEMDDRYKQETAT